MPPRAASSAVPLRASDMAQAVARGLPPVVVLAGAERFFREEALGLVVDHVLPEGDPGGAFLRFDARRAEDREGVSAAVDELRSVSLFGGGKVVAIDNPESASGPWAAVARTSPITVLAKAALQAPGGDGVLVLLTSKGVKGRDAAPVKTLQKAGALVVDCRALYDSPGAWKRGGPKHDHELARFLASRMGERHGKRMGLPEAHLLTELIGTDLSALVDALESLALYVGDGDHVRTDDVHATHGARRSDPAWRLVDAVFEGDRAGAIALLEGALARGLPDARGTAVVRGEALFGYLGAALHGQYRKILAGAEALAAGEDPGAISRDLGIPSFLADSFLARCRRDPRKLLDAHGAFFAAEMGVKGGRVPAAAALERLVVDLLTRVPSSA